MTDIAIVQGIKSGNTYLFSELYERYVEKIYSFIFLKVSSREEAEDLTSEVFFKAYEKINTFSEVEGATFKSWLYKIAYNKVIDYYRSQKEWASLDEIDNFVFIEENIWNHIDNKDKLKEVFNFVRTLKKEHREVIVMRIWEDLSYKEIAEITGLTENNCKKIVSRNIKTISENFAAIMILLIIL